MTSIRPTNAAETWPTDDPGVPTAPANDPLEPIDASPILMRGGQSRRAIPEFGGDEGEPLDTADLVRQVEDAAGTAVRAWSDIWPAPHRRADGPDATSDDSGRALAARRAEIAKLQEIQQKQADALRHARGEILSLDDAAKLLRAQLKQQEKETAAAQQAAKRADDEKAALRSELEQANANFAELLNQSAELKTAFGKREKEINAVRATVASLKAELTAKAGETDLTAAIEEAKTRYYTDFNKRCAQFEGQIEQLAHMLGARDEHMRNLEAENAGLAARCEVLAGRVADLDAGKHAAEKKLESQAAMVTFLDATLQAERETTGRKIAELATQLQQERLNRAAESREAAMVCKEILQLMPRLARTPKTASS